MILIVSNARDLTTDYVVLELQRRDLPYVRLNTERLPEAQVRLGTASLADWSIALPDRRIDGASIKAAYFRRPGAPEPDEHVNAPGERHYCASEWSALLKSLYLRLDAQWLSSPSAIAAAEDKPYQLLLARTLGFDVPETLVTNDVSVLDAFVSRHPSVAKPLRHALIDTEVARVMFTTRVDRAISRDARSVAAAPMILQREIPKLVDIRVTIVGERVFTAEIHSQESAEAEVDWRAGDGISLRHEIHVLPPDLAGRCVALVKALGLGFGAIDLILDRGGIYWFLEINPNGQWAWIENRVGHPIAAAIVDALEAKVLA